MKKLLALAMVSLFTLSCQAGHHARTISIQNNTGNEITVRDKDNHETTVRAHRSGSLGITVHEPHGSLFPSSLMPHVTEITVEDDEGSNSIKVDEHTRKVIVNEGLELSTGDSENNGKKEKKHNKRRAEEREENEDEEDQD